MCDSTHLKSHHRRRRHWCCSFSVPPLSPEDSTPAVRSRCQSLRSRSSKNTQPFSNSPQKPPLARRILSPGRVSPISDNALATLDAPKCSTTPKRIAHSRSGINVREDNFGVFDVRLNLKGKDGGSLILELDSEVLTPNSSVFANLVADYRKNLSGGLCRIEVPDVENLNVFRETIELMFEPDIQKKLLKIGVCRAIDMLEVSAGIKFTRGVSSCLRYIEAVPWTEEEEERLRGVFSRINFDDASTSEILDRLFCPGSVDSHGTLTKQLIASIMTCTDANARNELKALVKGLLSKSSVYEKNSSDVNKRDILVLCESCLSSLVTLLEEASGNASDSKCTKNVRVQPLLERISKQVDNINWLLEIMLDHQMAEEFVDLWANQGVLSKMHEHASPMIRYELSRVTATLFIAISSRRLHCQSETRIALVQVWFRPMLSDFGWLQRCRKGLDMKALEEAIGQVLLTLPLKEQYAVFMDWFACFSKHGSECPNLSKAFQVWWRRSCHGGLEELAIESR